MRRTRRTMGVLWVNHREDSRETPGSKHKLALTIAGLLLTTYHRRVETLLQHRQPTAAAMPQRTPLSLTRRCHRRDGQHCPTEAARARPVSPSGRGASGHPGRSQRQST